MPGHAYLVTTCTHQRSFLMVDWRAARLVIREMQQLHEEAWLCSQSFVVMPDHVHWLFTLGDVRSLSQVVRRFKGRSARSINHYLQRQGPVWETGFHDRLLRREEDLKTVARYIIANPLRAGLVETVGQYPHWDAVWL
ncbi:transposase [Modicisalibacter tunisiensis]|uniref:Transposase n=2 Tax=Halomonadaceae TaxID=28256 RepID=A0ABS7WU59_9GAMM|nr:transposase [Modicisalibacter tunisiensis]